MTTPTTQNANSEPARGTLFVVSAPSGAGKTSLVRALVESDRQIVLSVSHTTREQRTGETAGGHYNFVTESEFCRLIADKAFIEHAKVFDHRYGTTRHSVEENLNTGRDVILEIDWQGAQQVRAQFPVSRGIFILPPSLDALRQRLNSRQRDSAAVIEKRLAAAVEELTHYAEFDYLVVNHDFQTAVTDLCSIIASERLILSRQRLVHRGLLMRLLS